MALLFETFKLLAPPPRKLTPSSPGLFNTAETTGALKVRGKKGPACFNKDDFDTGMRQFLKALELSPSTKESHFNYLLAAVIAGRENIAAEQLQILQELGYDLGKAEYVSIAQDYFQAGNKQKVAEYYELVVAADSGDANAHAKLAASYKDICEVEKARAGVEEAVRLNPSFVVEAQQFLRELEESCGK